MSNYIICIEWIGGRGTLVRRTNLNLRNCDITDMKSATAAIEKQMAVDGFEFTEMTDKNSYYIVMLAKVDS